MRLRVLAGAAIAVSVTSACGFSVARSDPRTEDGARDAVVAAAWGALEFDADVMLDFMSAECRDRLDEVRFRAVLPVAWALNGGGEDLDLLEIVAETEEFTGDTARIRVDYVVNGESDLVPSGSEMFDVVYERGRWVDDDCDV